MRLTAYLVLVGASIRFSGPARCSVVSLVDPRFSGLHVTIYEVVLVSRNSCQGFGSSYRFDEFGAESSVDGSDTIVTIFR